MEPGTLTKYDFYKGPKPIGDMWTLTRGELTMRCAVSTHSLGWELKLTAGASFSRSQVCKTQAEVFATADAWKAEAIGKGWS
jgi:hypothetical protein